MRRELVVLALAAALPSRCAGQLYAIPKDFPVKWSTVEARLSLDCREIEPKESVRSTPVCYTELKNNKPEFFQRQGGFSRFIGDIDWKQEWLRFPQNYPAAEVQDMGNRLQFAKGSEVASPSSASTGTQWSWRDWNRPTLAQGSTASSAVNYGVWTHGVYNSWVGCDTREEVVGTYCRYLLVCAMYEEIWGELDLGALTISGPKFRHLYDVAQVKDRDALAPKRTPACLVCPVQACKSFDCPNGKVNLAPMPVTMGKVITKPGCEKSCSPGFFLTCKFNAECQYQVLTQRQWDARTVGDKEWYAENVYRLKVDANIMLLTVAPPPLSECYPCSAAKDRTHYGVTTSTDASLFDEGFLKFYCPGGDAAPVMCGQFQATKVLPSGATTGCGCLSGYYYNGTLGKCALCEAGFYCEWEGMSVPVPRECPSDTYSTVGSKACAPCDMEARCEAGKALTRCKKAQGSETKGKYQTKNSYCVQCLECQQLGGDKPCYKVTPLIASVPT